jgi:RES domain-containing protein
VAWAGEVWRHMFAGYPPERPNSQGGRWNPPGVDAIYTSLERDTALAEAEATLAAQPLRPAVRRDLHHIRVKLGNVIDLTDAARLERLGLPLAVLESESRRACARIGGAVALRLGHDGALVPSVRRVGAINLVIYPNNQELDAVFEVIETIVIEDL